MSQIHFTSLADRLAASGIQEQASVQGHTLKLGQDITVNFARLTAQKVAAPAAKAGENVRVNHARDHMQDSARTMIETLVALGARGGDRNSMVGTLLSKMWESAVHQQRLDNIQALNPKVLVSQTVVSSSPAAARTAGTGDIHIGDLQQEQLDLLVYQLSDQDLVSLCEASSGQLMDALDESLAELGKSADEAVARNIRSLHDSFQKLRLAVMNETGTRLHFYGRTEQNKQQYQELHAALASIHARNEERLKSGDAFVQEQEKAQCQRETERLYPQLQAALAAPELELSAGQQRKLAEAGKSLYLQDRNSLHAQARQALMDEGHPRPSAEEVLGKAQHMYCARLCASMGKPGGCERSTGFRAALFSGEAACVQHNLHSSLQTALGRHPGLQPFADMLCTVALKNADLMRAEFTSEADNLRTLLQGGEEQAEAVAELYGGFHLDSESDLAGAALLRASMNLLHQSWMAVRNMGEKPMQPEVWSRLLNCAGRALHVQGLHGTDVARLMPLALHKAASVADQMRELTQQSGDAPLSGLKEVVAQCADGIPTNTEQEKSVVASAVMELAEALLAQKPDETLPLQSPNQRLAELAENVNASPAPGASAKRGGETAPEDAAYSVVWHTPASFSQLIPPAMPLKERYDLAKERHNSNEAVLAPLRAHAEQAEARLEAVRTDMQTSEAEHRQALNKTRTELAGLQTDNADLRQRGSTLQEQRGVLVSERDNTIKTLQDNSNAAHVQGRKLLAASRTAQAQTQDELTILDMQAGNVRENLMSMRDALQQGPRDATGCRQWAEAEMQRHATQEAQIGQKRQALHDDRITLQAHIMAAWENVQRLSSLAPAPSIAPVYMTKTLNATPVAQRDTVKAAMLRYNAQLDEWNTVREAERALMGTFDATVQNLAAEHKKMATLRTEQLHLFVAQDAQLPWQGTGPRPSPQKITARLNKVQQAIGQCAVALGTHTATLADLRSKLDTRYREEARMGATLEHAAESLPAATVASDIALVGSRYIGLRHDSIKLQHNELTAAAEQVQHQHQPAYAKAVLGLLNAAEAPGVQDALLRRLALNEASIFPPRIAEAETQLEKLGRQRQEVTATLARRTARADKYQAVVNDPYPGEDRRPLDLAEEAVQENTQALADNAAALQSNEAAQATLTMQVQEMLDARTQAHAQEAEALREATNGVHEARHALQQREADVAPEEEAWQNLSGRYDNYVNLMKNGQPVADGQQLENRLNDAACLRMAAQEDLPLNNEGRAELSRVSAALLHRAHPVPQPALQLGKASPLPFLRDGLPIPRELLQPAMLAGIVEETVSNMPEAVNALLTHDKNLLPWKDLFQHMNAEAGKGNAHPLTPAVREQLDTIMSDAHNMAPEQWKLTYGEACSLESLVRLACLRAMRGAVNTVQTTAALQSDDLTLLLQGYSLDAIRQLRKQAESAPLEERAKYTSAGHHLAALARSAELPESVRETARRESQALIPLLCAFHAALRNDPPYTFRSVVQAGHTSPRTEFALEGILRLHQQTQKALATLSLPAAAEAGRPEHADEAMRTVAGLVKQYHQLLTEDSTQPPNLPPAPAPVLAEALRPLLLVAPATSLARSEEGTAERVAETLNSPPFLQFAGHVQHLRAEEAAQAEHMPQLTLLAQRMDDLLIMRDALNKELGIQGRPVPLFTYARENVPQSVRAALAGVTLPTAEVTAPPALITELTAAPRRVCPRLEVPVTNDARATFLNSCRQELNGQQYEENMRALLYGAALCGMVRATGSEVDGNMVFHALAGRGLSEEARFELLGESLDPDDRALMLTFLDDGAGDTSSEAPSLEEEVIRAALKIEKGTLSVQDASSLNFALPAHPQAQEAQTTVRDLLQENVLLHNLSDPCPNMPARFDALREKELQAAATLPHAHTVAQLVENFDNFRNRVENYVPLPASEFEAINTEYTALYKVVEAQLDAHEDLIGRNAGLANYLEGFMRANKAQFPRLHAHAHALRGEV